MQSYSKTFGENYFIRFVDLCMMNIVTDVMPSNVLSANPRATYSSYIRVVEKMKKHRIVLSLLVNLPSDAPAAKTLAASTFMTNLLIFL